MTKKDIIITKVPQKISVRLTQEQRDWLEAQIKLGKINNLSDYVRALIDAEIYNSYM